MTSIGLEGQRYDCREDETVLAALERHGVELPSSCRNGTCQSCLVRCVRGDPGAQAQRGLRETLRSEGYFLACQSTPAADIDVALAQTDSLFRPARIVARAPLASRIAQILVELDDPFDYQPGQFVHLRRADGLVRSYSLASLPGPGAPLELHVTRLEHGAMSSWLHDVAIGTALEVRGPSGSSFYVEGRPQQPLLLVGTGSGLAPLIGILRAAHAAEHTGQIHLYHGSTSVDGLYLMNTMRELAAGWAPLSYHPCVDVGDRGELRIERADRAALADHRNLAGWRVFLCGHPEMVRSMKKMAYLQGAALDDIYVDPFDLAPAAA